MHKRWRLALLVSGFLFLVCFSISKWNDGRIPTDPDPPSVTFDQMKLFLPPGPHRLLDVPNPLQPLIARGIEALQDERLKQHKCGGKGKGWRKCIGDYLLSAVNQKGEMEIVEAYTNRESHPPHFRVRCEIKGACDGGVNSPFLIESPPGWTVVALRTAVYRGKNGTLGAVYCPYSSRLNTPEFREAGIEYLRRAITTSTEELRKKRILSQHIPYRLVTDFGTPDHLITLVLTEQMWNDRAFVAGGNDARLNMLNRSLVTIGLNRERTYHHTRSRPGAVGIGQLMPKTYLSLRRHYREVRLPASLDARLNHEVAFKSMALHTDDEWWAFSGTKRQKQRQQLLEQPWERRLVFAAGYNANIGTVRKAILSCKDDWRKENCRTLPGETRRYLVKYEWIYKTLFDPAFHRDIRAEYSARK